LSYLFSGEVPEQSCVKNGDGDERNEAPDNNSLNIGRNLVYLKENPLFYLDAEYLANSGLNAQGNLVLYCRPQFHEQFKFLQEAVCEQNSLGFILGPIGAGKSITALAFASTLDRSKWIVTWIHLCKSGPNFCVRFEGNTRRCLQNTVEEFDIRKALDWGQKGKKHILFLDDFCIYENSHKDIVRYAASWKDGNNEDRRVAVICPRPQRGHLGSSFDELYNVKRFFVYSWQLEEYM
jgi:hypothetical protein